MTARPRQTAVDLHQLAGGEGCSPYIVVLDGFEVVIQLIDERDTSRNLKAWDVLV